MKIEGWSFLQSAEYLSMRTGIPLDNRRQRPVQRVAEREDLLVSQWWWQERLASVRAALDEAFMDHEGPNDQACSAIGAFLRWIESVPVRTRLEMFRRIVTFDERTRWRDGVAWDAEFGKAWIGLSGTGGGLVSL